MLLRERAAAWGARNNPMCQRVKWAYELAAAQLDVILLSAPEYNGPVYRLVKPQPQ